MNPHPSIAFWTCLVLMVLLVPHQSSAGDLSLGIHLDYRIFESRGEVQLQSVGMSNSSSTPSGYTELQLWATKTLYDGSGTLSGHRIARKPLGVLPGGFYRSVSDYIVRLEMPPAGRYYLVMVLVEEIDGRMKIVDSETFSTPELIGPRLEMKGPIRWRYSDEEVFISTGRIINHGLEQTSGMRLALWMMPDEKYDGGMIPVLAIAVGYVNLPALPPNHEYPARVWTMPKRWTPTDDHHLVVILEEMYAGYPIVRQYANEPTIFGELEVDFYSNDFEWAFSDLFGWIHSGRIEDTATGWIWAERFGWMSFVFPDENFREKPFLWVPKLETWMSINDDGSFFSFDFGKLVPTGMDAYYSPIFGNVLIGNFNGWVFTDQFGWVWAARDSNGVWFWSDARGEWLGVTPGGGIWSTREQRFL
ncbi:MAG: hypothetical protein ACLFRP_04510 [Puniceicoccaceae bacterium]